MPPTAGPFTFRGLLNPGAVEAVYDFSAGNPGVPPYRTPNGRGSWGGVWGSVVAAAAWGDDLYLLWGGEEGEGSLVKLDGKGRVVWKAHQPPDTFGVNLSLATDGDYVYVATDSSGSRKFYSAERRTLVWRVDAATGAYAEWSPSVRSVRIGSSYPTRRTPVFLDEVRNYESRWPHTTWEASARGMAAADGYLYVSLWQENAVMIVDASAGTEVGGIDVNEPQGLVVADGRIFVVSDSRVLSMAVDGTDERVIIAGALEAPYGLARDADGNLYVTDLGSSHQVKKFSPEGRLLAVWGREGGRPWRGALTREVFLFPIGLAVWSDRRLVVTEDSPPRRVLVLSAAGEVIEDWSGPQYYSGNIGVDDETPEMVVFLNGQDASTAPTVFRVDYERRSWRVESSSWGATWSYFPFEKKSLASGQYRPMVRHRDGRTFVFSGGDNHPVLELRDGYLAPIAALGEVLPISLAAGWEPDPDSLYDHLKYRLREDTMFFWSDANGDEEYDPREVTQYPGLSLMATDLGGWVDRQLNLYLPNFFHDEPGTKRIYKIPFEGFDRSGNPIYDPSHRVELRAGPFRGEFPVLVDDAGAIYVADNAVGGPIEGQPDWGRMQYVHDIQVMKYDPQGNLLWKAGKRATREAQPGEFYKIVSVAGALRGFVFFVDVNGQERVYTDDGLYVATLLDDPFVGYWTLRYSDWWDGLQDRLGQSLFGVEQFGARVFEHPVSHVIYLMTGADAIHFLRIQGLDRVVRIQGAVGG